MFSVDGKLKYDKRKAPRPELLVSVIKLREQRPQHYKSVLGLSLGEDYFCSSESMQHRSMRKRTKLVVSARILQKLRSQTQTSQSLSLGECVGLRDIFLNVLSDRY
jgi:hypothetical protein